MKVKKTINVTNKEFSDLCDFLEWKINHPKPCGNCQHPESCCGCPEQSAWVNTYTSMPGYELSKNEELKDFCEAFTRLKKAKNAFEAVKKEWHNIHNEFLAAEKALDNEYDNIVVVSVEEKEE